MLNQAVIVGRIEKNPKLEEVNNKKYCNLELAVQRTLRNKNGEFEIDYIKCKLTDGVAENAIEYCKGGDLVGIKGRIETEKIKDRMENIIIAEKLTFLGKAKNIEKNKEKEM